MADDPPIRIAEKLIALILVAVWGTVYIGLSFEAFNVVEPRFWGVFTAVVFVLVGKLWDLEIQKYLPGKRGSNTDDKKRGGD